MSLKLAGWKVTSSLICACTDLYAKALCQMIYSIHADYSDYW